MEYVLEFTENISEADAILALLSKIKKNSRIQAAAHSNDTPIYVTKVRTINYFVCLLIHGRLFLDWFINFYDGRRAH